MLAACGSDTTDNATDTTAPVTTTSPAAATTGEETSADVSAHPEKVVGVTIETSDMVLLLAGPERMAAVAESSKNPHMGMLPDLARQVEPTVPAGVQPDAEQILSFEPDLVVNLARHSGQQPAAELMAASGVSVIQFSGTDFETPESYAAALEKTGEALGEKDKAAEEAQKLLDRIGDIDADAEAKAAESETDGLSVLGLIARGDSILTMSDHSMAMNLVKRAGGTNAAAEAGMSESAPIDPERVVLANPDIIIVEDFMGQGMASYEEFLSNPAFESVPAIANDDVHLLLMTEASSVSGINTPVGYQKIVDILYSAR